MSIERAISIRQPFVELILQGVKREEYRSRPTNIRERVYLYASLQPFESDEDWEKVGRQPGQLPVGLILGSVEIVDCRPEPSSDGYAYVLRDPMRLTPPLKPLNQPQPVFWRPEFRVATKQDERSAIKSDHEINKAQGRRQPAQLYEPDNALAAVIGRETLPRAKIVSQLWEYISKNNLQDEHDKEIVNADDKLHALFGKKRLTLDEIASLLVEHIREA